MGHYIKINKRPKRINSQKNVRVHYKRPGRKKIHTKPQEVAHYYLKTSHGDFFHGHQELKFPVRPTMRKSPGTL